MNCGILGDDIELLQWHLWKAFHKCHKLLSTHLDLNDRWQVEKQTLEYAPPVLNSNDQREDECIAWLNDNGGTDQPEFRV
jgi:hypothetical protein